MSEPAIAKYTKWIEKLQEQKAELVEALRSLALAVCPDGDLEDLEPFFVEPVRQAFDVLEKATT